MALSGSANLSVGSHWDLKIEWSATQNVGANQSTITAKLYWIADGYGAVRSSQDKDGWIDIDGTKYNFTASAGLSGGQKKLLASKSRTISHNSNGDLTVTIGGMFDADVTLSGSFKSNLQVYDSATPINSIPRGSTLDDASPSWWAGNDMTLSINRYSSSFRHEVEIYLQDSGGSSSMPSDAPSGWANLNCTHLKQVAFSTSQTTKSTNFTTAEKKEAFQRIANVSGNQVKAWVRLQTFKGDDLIDTREYYSICTSPRNSYISTKNFTVGNTVKVNIDEQDDEFEYDLVISSGSFSKKIKSREQGSDGWNYDSSPEKSAILAAMPKKTASMTFTLTTYYDGVKVGSNHSDTVTVTVPSSEVPTFNPTITYKDTNSTMNGIKGGVANFDTYIIQNKSTVQVITTLASAKTGTTMKEYQCTINGVTNTKAHPSSGTTVTFDTFAAGVVNVNKNISLTIRAVDNRGMATTASKVITIVPYQPPSVMFTPDRLNGWDSFVSIDLSGTISPLNISGNKNSVVSMKYRYAEKNKTFTALTNFTAGTATFPAYKAVQVTNLPMDKLKSWIVEVQVTDKITTTTISREVPVGIPLFFLDSDLKSIGINTFPTQPNSMEVNKVVISGNSYGTDGGGIDMQNSDIVKVNGLWFNDAADNDGEGLLWNRTSTPNGSSNIADYDNFRVRDGVVYLNNVPMYSRVEAALWSGALYPNASDVIDLSGSKALSQQPNGWFFVWSDYDVGMGANDNQYVFSVVPKQFRNMNGTQCYFIIPNYTDTTGSTAGDRYITKVLGVYNDKLTGFASNNATNGYLAGSAEDRRDVVLRAVYSF